MTYRWISVSFVAALSLAACSKKSSTATTTPAAPATVSGTLVALENGDRACYVRVTTDAGEQSLEGDFELCPGGGRDASALIGQRVTWTTVRSNVLAADCEGDVDCGRSDEVDLVTTISAAP